MSSPFGAEKPFVGADVPIPGYSGFRPSHLNQKWATGPSKPSAHIGRPTSHADQDARAMATVDAGLSSKVTEYTSTFGKIRPEDTSPFSKTGGGYWFTERQVSSPKPFIGSTCYRSELLEGGETASRQLRTSEGIRSTLVGYEAARQRPRTAELSSPNSPSLSTRQSSSSQQRPKTAMTASGEIAGYQSTYSAAMGASAEKLAQRRASLLLTSPHLNSPPQEPRWGTLPAAMAPGMFGTTPSSKMDYGTDGSDPVERSFTTRDLNEGSVKTTRHPPGYTGHTPASHYNVKARFQAEAWDTRPSKDSLNAYALDQYNHKPAVTDVTTYGAANAQVIKALSRRL